MYMLMEILSSDFPEPAAYLPLQPANSPSVSTRASSKQIMRLIFILSHLLEFAF